MYKIEIQKSKWSVSIIDTDISLWFFFYNNMVDTSVPISCNY